MVLNDLMMHVEWIMKIMCDGDLDMCRGFPELNFKHMESVKKNKNQCEDQMTELKSPITESLEVLTKS